MPKLTKKQAQIEKDRGVILQNLLARDLVKSKETGFKEEDLNELTNEEIIFLMIQETSATDVLNLIRKTAPIKGK